MLVATVTLCAGEVTETADARARAPAWKPDVAAARAYAAARRGTVSYAVRTPNRAWGLRSQRTVSSASVVKAMLMVAYLRRPAVASRALGPADRALLDPMIRASDNDAASRVFGVVGDPGLLAVARAARMRNFSSGGPFWGSSRITAGDQARFFLRIDARLPARHRAYGLRLLRTIASYQRWGIARARPDGWTLYFKGGWGSSSGAVDHQVALLRRGTQRVSVAILTDGSPSKAYGDETLRGVARRLLRGLDPPAVGVVQPAVAGGVLGRSPPT